MSETKDGHTEAVWSKVDAVVTLILDNLSYLNKGRNPELVKIVMERFEIKVRQAETYVSLAKREVRKLGREKKKNAFEKVSRRNEYLYQKSKGEDKKLAFQINQEYAKLNDLYPDQKVKTENINKNIDYDKLTDKALRRISVGEDPDVVLSDITSYRHNANDSTDTSGS